MADPVSHGNPERDVQQALVALKKGSSLIKYSRKGKPKLCPFRLSPDETTLIWYSRKEERNLKLGSVSQIVPGQRTPVFRRYFCPEKDYLSFSLIYNNGERSLDLICKDKAEAEIWFAGLKVLVSKDQRRISRIDGRSGRFSDVQSNDHGHADPFSWIACHFEISGTSRANNLLFSSSSVAIHSFRRHGLHLMDSGEFFQSGSSFSGSLESASSISHTFDRKYSVDLRLPSSSQISARSDVGPDRANMLRASNADGFRISVSSAPSSSSQGSGPDDCESLGDVYVWGEVWCDNSDASIGSVCSRTDVLVPKPLESNVVLDVHQISCGVKHVALVTRQGEVFTWGEESSGRLGHGTDKDVTRPQLVELLAACNVDYVACGEYHTCAVSVSGNLFTWGDGTHTVGLLGHGSDVSHWMPKRVSGSLESLQVLSVACGTWHTALVTSNAKLFTFGDGSFGVLGHGDRESVAYPREVDSLSGVKTIKVACGVWHTAAIVEVSGQTGANMVSRKLFTWGDGDKYRLGHGDKEARLVPTCVSSLIDYNFHQLACGHAITIALATSGHVFTMGSTAFGQLGNIHSDGKKPCLVQDRLSNELVEDIACGACHVAVLTSRSEIFTWGKGANGRLGHGDIEDRKTPTLVEALKDRHVKSISCGSNFTASICIHKWVSGADQSVCSGCRQAFGFTRKRHNCYNCGMVHCHGCSSRKVMRAALAPTPGKPHRVCDSCYTKLKAAEAGNNTTVNRKNVVHRRSADTRERSERGEIRYSRSVFSPIVEPVKYFEIKTAKARSDYVRGSQASSIAQLKEVPFPATLSALQTSLRPIVTSSSSPLTNSRPSSPYSRKSSPQNCGTPDLSRGAVDNLKKMNEILNQDVLRLQAQIRNLRQRCDLHDAERKKVEKRNQELCSLTAEESHKCCQVVELVKSLALQVKDQADKLPSDFNDNLVAAQLQAESLMRSMENRALGIFSTELNLSESEQSQMSEESSLTDGENLGAQVVGLNDSYLSHGQSISDTGDIANQNLENGLKTPPKVKSKNDGETEITEQFEPGVYVTLVRLQDGSKVFKRIRFSKRRFVEQQAEDWWKENQERIFRKYCRPIVDMATSIS